MFEVDIQTLLQTNMALASVPMTFATDPQSIGLPKITFSKVGESREISNDGDVGDAVINLQINCIAMSLTQAKTLARAVKTTMVGAMGTTVGGTEFGSIVLEAERDIAAEIEGGIEKGTQVSIQSWRISCIDILPIPTMAWQDLSWSDWSTLSWSDWSTLPFD